MSSEFVKTQVTLLRRIAVEKTGEDEASWARFFELYYPAMVAFAKGLGGKDATEDVVQDVLVKLVDALRHGKYDADKGQSFRAYVKQMIRNQLVDLYRREKSRGAGRKVTLTIEIADETADEDRDPGAKLDTEWAEACRHAAIDHVLTKMALSEQNKAVYKAYVLEGRPLADVAKEFGLSKNNVSQIKTRLDRVIASIIAEYGN